MPKKKATLVTPETFRGLELLIDTTLEKRLVPLEEKLIQQMHEIQQTVDAYLKQTIGWDDEQTILTARVDKMSDVMIDKKIASGRKLAI